ncbi:hypothetical protein ACQEVF_27555 [Nonomuraea polychroma]|uniref:hypothetical protein n=1 Tax=Nonomuraea polychroma TaxID=46176 RepID=UPI003D92DE72
MRHYFNVSLLSFTPVWPDEVDYWHQVATFRTVGFAGGIYGVGEAEAKLSFIHFGSHGPAFPMLMAGVSAIAGWRPFSGPLINLTLLGAAIFGYLAWIRAGWGKATLTGALVLTFWPVMVYLPSTMQESVNQALAIALAGPFFLLIRRGPHASRTVYATAVALLALASLLRPTWAPLFLALFFLRGATLTGRQLTWAIFKTIPIIVAAFGLWNAAVTPYPGFVSQLTEAAGRSPLVGVKLLLLHFWSNAQALAKGHPLELALRVALLAITVTAAVSVVRRLRRSSAHRHEDLAAGAFHLFNLVLPLALMMGLHNTFGWHDFRVLGAHVLLSVLVALARSEFIVMIATLTANLLVIGAVGLAFSEIHRLNFMPVDPKTVALGHHIMYKRDVSVWDNTLMVDFPNFGPGLVNVPAGVGLSLLKEGIDRPIRSRYLLITDETARKIGVDRLQLLATTAKGNLYLRKY